ncbi:extracellular solute-binding protein [Promicromonospora sukumoe]|uniref:Multiple sugar transport system substrate-binding protein n=1 Tax=Promicromonospora sukumoe TaxID=88382 RepID=A0A7W3J9S4_9MICO|nr:sugar ABC transporter substrate-binding protein [Promicromonospora sukumoe]MBA8808804.1 multiple sugar transport system substrate-binding protein [Promicromonospora sukumoe]
MERRVRRGVLAGSALALSVGVAGCGIAPDPADAELSEGDVTLTMTWWGADARHQATLDAIELFEEKNPRITVEPTYADWGGYWDRLATTAAAGDMPDVVQFDQLYLASYAGRGALLDLDALPEFVDASSLPETVLGGGRVDGSLYAVPIGVAGNGVVLNTSVFEKYGVPVPDTDTWTWDEFNATAEAITEASGGEVHGLTPFGADSFTLEVFARQRGEALFNEEGDVAIDPATLAAYWQQRLDWIESGAAPSAAALSEKQGVPLDQGSLVVGDVAMEFQPAGLFTAISAAAPDSNFEIVDWPADPGTQEGFQYPKPSMYWAGSSQSEHPAEAALLIDFLVNDPEVAEAFGTERGIPASEEFQAAVEPSLDEAGRKALTFTELVSKEAGDAPPITPNGASEVETILSRYNQQVQFGQLTPQDAAQRFIEELQSAIDATG